MRAGAPAGEAAAGTVSPGAGGTRTLYPGAGVGGQDPPRDRALPASAPCLSLPTPSPYPALVAPGPIPAPANGEPYVAGIRGPQSSGLARGPGAGRGREHSFHWDRRRHLSGESTSSRVHSRLHFYRGSSRLFVKAPFVSASSHSRGPRAPAQRDASGLGSRTLGVRCLAFPF